MSWKPDDATPDSQSVTSDWQPADMPLIDGVRVREVRNVPTAGRLTTELYRRDWGLDQEPVDQVFQVRLEPGTVSAWHAHAHTTDRLFVTEGLIKIVLCDLREGSPTHRQINEFRCGPVRPMLVIVPPRVWHGVQNVSSGPAAIVNIVDHAYDYESPDHWRLPSDTEHIPYSFDGG